MRITRISATHIKGIDHVDICCDLYPNKPNFIVAPNGTGKSSLAKGFNSLNRNRLKLEEADYHNETPYEDSSLVVESEDGNVFRADANRNDISANMDVFVINSGLYAAQIPRRAGGRSITEARLSVPDIELWKKKPQKSEVDYSITEIRRAYPPEVRKALHNFSDMLADSRFLEGVVACEGYRAKTSGARYSAAIDDFIEQLVSVGGTREEMLGANLDYERLKKVAPVESLAQWLKERLPDKRDPFVYLNAIQLKRFSEARQIELDDALSYLRYKAARRDIDELLAAVNTTGNPVKTEGRGDAVFLKYPHRESVSNGELDILRFVGSLAMARQTMRKDRAMLLIDEVFDYLDDGNLLVAQYYLLKLMQQFKARGAELYVVILTHLDPRTLQSYSFKSKHVSYFGSAGNGKVGSYMRSILLDRRNCQNDRPGVYECVSSQFLHYHPNARVDSETEQYLMGKGVPADLLDPSMFSDEMARGLREYLSGKPYDAAKVCCALRLLVEKFAHDEIGDAGLQEEFLSKDKGTLPRLEYAEECGVRIPDIMHLLASIYNSCMHLNGADSEEMLLVRKLDNNSVRSIVAEVVSMCRAVRVQ